METGFENYIEDYCSGHSLSFVSCPHVFFELTAEAYSLVVSKIRGPVRFLGPYNFLSTFDIDATAEENYNAAARTVSGQDARDFIEEHRFVEYAATLVPGGTEWSQIAHTIGTAKVCYDIDAMLPLLGDLLKTVEWALIILPEEPSPAGLFLASPESAGMMSEVTKNFQRNGLRHCALNDH